MEKSIELEKEKAEMIVEIIGYVPNSVVTKIIIERATGSVKVMSFDSGEGLGEKRLAFDTFTQIIEGEAAIIINNTSYLLQTGEGIIIPAHAKYYIKQDGRFKMIQTIIKSGYE